MALPALPTSARAGEERSALGVGSGLTPSAPAAVSYEQIFVHDLRRLPPGHTLMGRLVCWLHRTPQAYLALLYWKGMQVFKVGG